MNLRQALMATPLYDWLGKRSYAQSGEDIIAWGEIKNSRNQELKNSRTQERKTDVGFYVDVGAYHPKLFSNTYLFYKKGWRGICVEPNPEMGRLFGWVRPRDTFLNLGVGEEKNQKIKKSKTKNKVSIGWIPDQVGNDNGRYLGYFEFEDGAANTFSPAKAKENQKVGRKLKRTLKIPIKSLKEILDENLPKGQKIDLMSVDVEGMDLEVLKSNDWKKYRPRVIVAEDLGFDFNRYFSGMDSRLRGNGKGGVVGFLRSVGYKLVAITPYSLIFVSGIRY